MPRPGERGRGANPGRSRSAPAARLLVLAALLVSGLAGCNFLHKRDAEDPLVGPGPKGLKPAEGTATKTNSPVPPVPAANSSASNADLAVGQLAGGRPLELDDHRPGSGNWQGAGRGEGVVPASAGVVLSRPEPDTGPPQVQSLPAASEGNLTPVPVYGAAPQQPAGAPTGRVDPLVAALSTRGGTLLSNEVTRDGVFLRCVVPERANPDRMHVYEATGPDAASALQTLLGKIDRDR